MTRAARRRWWNLGRVRGGNALAALALAAALGGCRPTLASLPAHEQARWQRCARPVRATCMTTVVGGEPLFEARCTGGARDDYAAQPTEAARRQYLIDRGCEPRDVR